MRMFLMMRELCGGRVAKLGQFDGAGKWPERYMSSSFRWRMRVGDGSSPPDPGDGHEAVNDVHFVAYFRVVVQYRSCPIRGRGDTNLGNQVQGVRRLVLPVSRLLPWSVLLHGYLPKQSTAATET